MTWKRIGALVGVVVTTLAVAAAGFFAARRGDVNQPLSGFYPAGYFGDPQFRDVVVDALADAGVSRDQGGIPIAVVGAEAHVDASEIRITLRVHIPLIDGVEEWEGVGRATFHYEAADGEFLQRPHTIARRLAVKRAVADIASRRNPVVIKGRDDDLDLGG